MDKPKVLYIDDDVGVLMSSKYLISDICDLVTERSPKKAVEHLRSGARYDIIFLDLSMAEWDGIEVLKVLRAEYPDLPVFMVSGWTGGDARLKESQKLGAKGHISKPFQKDIIKKAIEEVVRGK